MIKFAFIFPFPFLTANSASISYTIMCMSFKKNLLTVSFSLKAELFCTYSQTMSVDCTLERLDRIAVLESYNILDLRLSRAAKVQGV